MAMMTGADVNGKNKDGWAPLHLAALVGRVEVAELLLESGMGWNRCDAAPAWPVMAG
jgi:ankyrin repeat protein